MSVTLGLIWKRSSQCSWWPHWFSLEPCHNRSFQTWPRHSINWRGASVIYILPRRLWEAYVQEDHSVFRVNKDKARRWGAEGKALHLGHCPGGQGTHPWGQEDTGGLLPQRHLASLSGLSHLTHQRHLAHLPPPPSWSISSFTPWDKFPWFSSSPSYMVTLSESPFFFF